MKKLVSKNPILRFKLGKVIKAQSGFKTAKRHDYARGAVDYKQDENGRWLANYKNGPDTKQYYVAEGSTGYDRFGNHNILQNGKWVRIKGLSNQGIVGENGITKTESFDLRAKANGFNKRDEVKQLQEKLASIGLYDGNIDGLWGVKTQAAFDLFNNANYKAPRANTSNKSQPVKTNQPKNENKTKEETEYENSDWYKTRERNQKNFLNGLAVVGNILTPLLWIPRLFFHNLKPYPTGGYLLDTDNFEFTFKQGGQITKANNGLKIDGPYANQAKVDRWNKNLHKPYHFDVIPESQRTNRNRMDNAYVGPGSYNLQGVTFNRRNIRDNRNIYKTVDDYWNYLNSDEGMKSNDFLLWSNIMRTQDGALNREVFDNVMSKYGISGNLGRRDSGRLANVLNTLNEIGTNGSEARKAFINSYNTAFIPATEARVANVVSDGTPTSTKINIQPASTTRVANVAPTGTPTSTIINRNTQPSSTQSVSTTRRFAIPDYAGQFRSWVLSLPLFSGYAKQGGKLISRNPVKQFKQK